MNKTNLTKYLAFIASVFMCSGVLYHQGGTKTATIGSIRKSSRVLLYMGVQPVAAKCPPGSYREVQQDGITLGECRLCPRGVYGSTYGLTSKACTAQCPKGTYNDRLGASSIHDCQLCPQGVYGSSTGLKTSACSAPCPLGTYSNKEKLTKASECIVCPPNYRGAQGLRGNNRLSRRSGGYQCDRYWKGKDIKLGLDELRETTFNV